MHTIHLRVILAEGKVRDRHKIAMLNEWGMVMIGAHLWNKVQTLLRL